MTLSYLYQDKHKMHKMNQPKVLISNFHSFNSHKLKSPSPMISSICLIIWPSPHLCLKPAKTSFPWTLLNKHNSSHNNNKYHNNGLKHIHSPSHTKISLSLRCLKKKTRKLVLNCLTYAIYDRKLSRRHKPSRHPFPNLSSLRISVVFSDSI